MTKSKTYRLKRKPIILTLLGIIGLSIALYSYLLNLTISHGVAVEKGTQIVSELTQRVGKLEQKYFEAKREVTLSLARNLGFVDAPQVTYLSRSKDPVSLSLRDEN